MDITNLETRSLFTKSSTTDRCLTHIRDAHIRDAAHSESSQTQKKCSVPVNKNSKILYSSRYLNFCCPHDAGDNRLLTVSVADIRNKE